MGALRSQLKIEPLPAHSPTVNGTDEYQASTIVGRRVGGGWLQLKTLGGELFRAFSPK